MQSLFSGKQKISNNVNHADNKENTIFEDHFILEEFNKIFKKGNEKFKNK